jgi:hypothetical protein
VKAEFCVRQGGGWWLKVICPFCGEQHLHGSNLEPDWSAANNNHPLIYAAAPKTSHCTGKKPQGVYVNEITSGLPAEANQHESEAGR